MIDYLNHLESGIASERYESDRKLFKKKLQKDTRDEFVQTPEKRS